MTTITALIGIGIGSILGVWGSHRLSRRFPRAWPGAWQPKHDEEVAS